MQYWAQTSLTLDLLFRKYAGDREIIGEKLPEVIHTIDTLLAGGGYDVLPLKDLPNPDELVPFVGEVSGAACTTRTGNTSTSRASTRK